jgi:surfactin synthase thioesterase subunit
MQKDMTGRVSLLCFPPAGGLACIYDAWREYAPDWVDIIGVEYPGHGSRSHEPAICDIEALADDVVVNFLPRTGRLLAILGVSMGGLVAFEFATRLTQQRQAPLHLFVCSCRNPRQRIRQKLHELPEDEFVAGLRRRQGHARFAGQNTGLPGEDIEALRADVTASERYVAPQGRRVDCPITLLTGAQDGLLPRRALALWCLLTSSSFFLDQLPGGHFFFRNRLDTVVAQIIGRLQSSRDQHLMHVPA